MSDKMKLIALGWGVQSFTLAAMVALGELEPIEAALHADTFHESELTYEYARRLTPWLDAHGVRVVTLPNPTGGFWEVTKRIGQTHIPAFTKNIQGQRGQLNRACTHRWKIVPSRRWMQANRNNRQVELWLGISTDEAARMKPSGVKYIMNRWPLIEKNMSRNDCVSWLEAHNLEVPPRSACVFCPFHAQVEWRHIQETPADWEEALKVDEHLRKLRPPYDLFLHPARLPLNKIDLRTTEERNAKQFRLWDEECSGICGV